MANRSVEQHARRAAPLVDTQDQNRPRKTWSEVLRESVQLFLSVAHDARFKVCL